MYQDLKLEKGMYHITGKSFSEVLEGMDPSGAYAETPLAGLDAYERQLKRFDIHVSGSHCDRVEKFFSTTDSAVLFPEFIRRAIRSGMEQSVLSDLAQGKSVWGYLYSNEEVLSVCEKVRISPGFFSIDAGAGKHTYLLQESGKTINVDAKIKQLNDINWIEIGYKEGDTFSVYGKEYAIDSSGHINVSAEDEFTSTEIKYPSRSI